MARDTDTRHELDMYSLMYFSFILLTNKFPHKKRSFWWETRSKDAMKTAQLDNANPLVKTTKSIPTISLRKRAENEYSNDNNNNNKKRDPIDAYEIFSHVKDVNDPEHPYSLEQLAVVSPENIVVDDEKSRVTVYFTPTVEHCSMATLIGLSIRVQLLRVLPKRFKVDVRIYILSEHFALRTSSPGCRASIASKVSIADEWNYYFVVLYAKFCNHPRSSATALTRGFLSPSFSRIQIKVSEGSHASETQVNKQLRDKERVAAALENGNLLEKVELTLSGKTAM